MFDVTIGGGSRFGQDPYNSSDSSVILNCPSSSMYSYSSSNGSMDWGNENCIFYMSESAELGTVDIYTDKGMPKDFIIWPYFDSYEEFSQWTNQYGDPPGDGGWGYSVINDADWVNIFCRDDLNNTRCIEPLYPTTTKALIQSQLDNPTPTTTFDDAKTDGNDDNYDSPDFIDTTNIIIFSLILFILVILFCWYWRNRMHKQEMRTIGETLGNVVEES